MNVYLNKVNESWIIDRVRQDWYRNKQIYLNKKYKKI